MITVKVHLKSQSQSIGYENAINTYTKDGLFCVWLADEKVHKFPLSDIFRVIEDYGSHRS